MKHHSVPDKTDRSYRGDYGREAKLTFVKTPNKSIGMNDEP